MDVSLVDIIPPYVNQPQRLPETIAIIFLVDASTAWPSKMNRGARNEPGRRLGVANDSRSSLPSIRTDSI